MNSRQHSPVITIPLYSMSNVPRIGGDAACNRLTCTLELRPSTVNVAWSSSSFSPRIVSATAISGRGEPQSAGRREMVQFVSEFISTLKSLMRKPFGLAGLLVGVTEKFRINQIMFDSLSLPFINK